METVIRLLPYAVADGPTNMAADETLLRSAVEGIPSLRFYGWTTATVSLGYFQPCAVRLADPLLMSLPWVRRPSGGATLVHHHELTYALALPAGSPWQTRASWLQRMHRIIQTALADLGVRVDCGTPIKHGDVLCFQQYTCGDLLSSGSKVVGSAQRKHRQALMQHGSILLARSEHTPALPGIRETADVTLTAEQLQDAIVRAFTKETGWRAAEAEWTEQERGWIDELTAEKYGNVAWNEKR
ncbi:MAG: lipoate--protein ligase family protein [Planctomycetes bacterium]|nr:lipoate--protein ligase family protein [Planctomycetota bacterium]